MRPPGDRRSPRPARPGALSGVLLGAVLVTTLLAGCAAAAEPTSPAGEPPAPVPVRTWDRESGWRTAPAVPVEAPRQAWTRDLPAGSRHVADGDTVVVAMPTVRGGDYAGDPTPRAQVTVVALEATTGAERWQRSVPASGGELDDLRLVGPREDPLVVLSERGPEATTVLDGRDGRPVYAGPGGPRVELIGDTVLLADLTAVALDRATGERRWELDDVLSVIGGTIVRTVRPTLTDPAEIADLADAAGLDRPEDAPDGVQHLQTIDPATGQVRDLGEFPTFSDLSALDGLLLVASDSGPDTLTALTPDGTRLWTHPVPGMGRAEASPFGPDAVVLHTFGPRPLVVDRTTALIRWDDPLGLSYTVLEVDGAPAIVGCDSTGYEQVYLDAQGTRTEAAVRTMAGSAIGSGALYVAGLDSVEALSLPGLVSRWQVPTGRVRGVSAVDGGFLVDTGDPAQYTAATTLVAYR